MPSGVWVQGAVLDAHSALGCHRSRSLELNLDIGAQVEHHLQSLLLDEPLHIARAQRLEVVRAEEHTVHDGADIDRPVKADPARSMVVDAHLWIVAALSRRPATRV
jgi:hypothetical protein